MKKLPKRTKCFFDQFINAAEKELPHHPSDWQRFYDFVHAAHQGRTNLFESQLKELLLNAGFPADSASDLASIYHHGRRLLKRKPAFNYVYGRQQ